MIKTGFYLGCYLLLTFTQGHERLDVYRAAERLEPAALQEDFEMFRQRLVQHHPGLYVYASKAQIDSAFAAIETKLDQPMSELAFYRLLTPLKSLIKDGHTYYYPSDQTQSAAAEAGNLPFQAFWDRESLWVREVYYEDIDLEPGDKILKINGIESKEIVQKLMANIIRDGENDTYPRWIMNQWFEQIYKYYYEISEQWELEILDARGEKRKLIFTNQPRISVPEQGEKPKGIELRYEGEVALLKVPSFNHALLKTRYQQKFRPEIKAAFEAIKQNKTENLILDLRDNQGGAIDNGRYLLSYLLEERFALVQALKKVVEPSADITEVRVDDKQFAKLNSTKIRPNRFAGKLVILMNGGSFSCSGAVLAQLEAAERGIFVGEAAAGNRRIFCGVGPTETLPNSKITLAVPRVQFYVVDAAINIGHGVLADYAVSPTIHDLINNKDVVLEKALSLFGE